MSKKFSLEFKQEVARVSLCSGLSRQQVADDFGVGISSVASWAKQYSSTPVSNPFEDHLKEIKQLRKELRVSEARTEHVVGLVKAIYL